MLTSLPPSPIAHVRLCVCSLSNFTISAYGEKLVVGRMVVRVVLCVRIVLCVLLCLVLGVVLWCRVLLCVKFVVLCCVVRVLLCRVLVCVKCVVLCRRKEKPFGSASIYSI